MTAFINGRIYSFDDQGVEGAFQIYTDGGNIVNDSTTVHTAGYSWKLSPTSTNRSATYPLELTLARFAVTDGVAYTIKCWVRRDVAATITAKVVIKGGQLTGIANDVTVTASAADNTWEQLTLAAVTPTENGVLEVTGQAYGGTTANAWFDDLAVNGIAITMDYSDPLFGPGPDPLVSAGSGGVIGGPNMRAGMMA